MTLGVIILAYFGNRLRVSYRTPLTGCVRDDGTGGASGVFLWADRIGIPVQAWEAPIWEAGQLAGQSTGNCVLTMGDGPWSITGEEIGPEDWLTAREWIARGNALIIVTTAPGSLPKSLQEDLIPAALHEQAASRLPFLGESYVDSRPETIPATVTSGGSLMVERDGPRWSASPTEGSVAGAPKASPAPNVKGIDVARWQLAGDARGGVLFRIPVGKGSVYILLDGFAWTNTGLDQGDNARVLANILHREVRGGVLAVDEYRHGHGRTESFLVYLANLPGSSAVMWLTAIWAMLYGYSRNVRLRPVDAYVEPERRTAQEYIDAVAQLYGRARAAPLVVEAVARRLRQVARSSAERQASGEAALLDRAEVYAKSEERPATPSVAISLVRDLIQLRKKIYGTRTIS